MNIHFLVVFFVSIIAMLADICIYFFGIEYIYALSASVIFAFLMFFICIYKYKNISLNFEKNDIFLYVILLIYMIAKNVFRVDNSYDVTTYHIYLQENPFMDKINFDFFPGRIFCVFLFPLGDRMYYIFRYFLGYRLGTIFSCYLIIVLFYQIKRILKVLNKDIKPAIYSYIVITIFMFVAYLGNYYIDNIATVFLVEIFYLILVENNLYKNKKVLMLIFLLSGIAIGIKISSIYFVAILAIYALIKNRKEFRQLKLFDFVLCGSLIILPYLVYMIDNYKQTGSILFPYYNKILKSEYFGLYNWVEPRFGIDGIIKKVFWPIVVSLQNKAYGDESIYIDPIWAIGYIVLIVYLVYKIIKKNKLDNLYIEAIIAMICTIIWIVFLHGYTRYGVFVVILYCVLISSCIYRFLHKKQRAIEKIRKKIENEIKFLFKNCNSLRNIGYYCTLFIIVSAGIIIAYNELDIDNIKYILKDRKNEKYNITIDGVWGAFLDNCSYEVLVRNTDTPIYNLEKEYYKDSPKALSMYYEKIKNNDIYMIIEKHPNKVTNEYLDDEFKENEFEIEEIIEQYTSKDIPYIDAHATWYLVKLKYVGEFK